MSNERADTAMRDSSADLERSIIDEFLRARGHDPNHLDRLSPAERDAILAEASVHASGKLSEIESRAHFVHELHEGGHGASKIGLE